MGSRKEDIMNFVETIQGISGWGWAGIAIVILSIIQIAPIKIDPWSWIARKIGKAFNQEMLEKQDAFVKESQEYRKNNDERMEKLSAKIDCRSAEDARSRILRFGDEIKSKTPHSQEYYNQILADMTDYEQYCATHPNFKNERTVATEKVIRNAYEMHMKNNDFL